MERPERLWNNTPGSKDLQRLCQRDVASDLPGIHDSDVQTLL
jgi:hypothetical protein